jgi:hypothetical protein
MENGKMYYYYSKEKELENDVTSGHLPSNDVISGDATSGYILKTNNPFCLFWEPLYCNVFYVI